MIASIAGGAQEGSASGAENDSRRCCGCALAVLALALSACEPPYLDPADYDRTCAQDTECALVLLTDICNCLEPPSAVNVGQVPRAQADRADALSGCRDDGCPPALRAWGDAVCTAGQCEFVQDPLYYSRPMP